MGKRLVRSRALDSWSVPGAEHQVRPVTDDVEHAELLKQKLLEEAIELVFAQQHKDVVNELADLYDVLEAIEQVYLVNAQEVEDKRVNKQQESGHFNPGLVWDTGR